MVAVCTILSFICASVYHPPGPPKHVIRVTPCLRVEKNPLLFTFYNLILFICASVLYHPYLRCVHCTIA